MKNIFALALAAFLTCAGLAAGAEETKPAATDPFRDWQATLHYAQSQGIDTNKINWTPINQLCAGLKMQDGDSAGNKCAYEKARDMVLHANDRAQCVTRAEGTFPDSAMRGRKDTLVEKDKNGVTHSFERTIGPVTAQELEQSRAGMVVECMQNLGWASASDWTFGRRNACP